MSTETLGLERPSSQPAVKTQHPPTLTRRASLNVVQALLDYSVKLGVGLLVVPIMVSGLGRTLFGVWEILGRLVGYVESADGRSIQALRLVISNQQSLDDPHAKRRWVGSALVVWLWFLPLTISAGAILVWIAPTITKVPADLHTTVRVAAALMMGALLIMGLATVPESVLRGMNLGYKRMGVQAGVSLLGGILLVTAVYTGAGLIGVAAAGVVTAAVTGLCFAGLARRQVSWFGAEQPSRPEVKSLFGMSVWLALGDTVSKLLHSDVIVLGAVLSASAVTTYVLTGYAARLALNLHSLSAEGVMPGIAGVIGERNFGRASLLRRELLAITALFITAVGTTILLWNRSFIHLWVGGDNYGGIWVNLLIVLLAVQSAFIRCDAYLIDASLHAEKRVKIGLAAGLATLGLGAVLAHWLGMAGLCLGILGGRAIQSIGYPILVRRCLPESHSLSMAWLCRPLIAMAVFFAAAAWGGQHIHVANWAGWIAAVPATLVTALALAFMVGLPPAMRAAVRFRMADLAQQWGQGGR